MKTLKIFLIPLLFTLFLTSCLKTKKLTYFNGNLTNASTDSFSNPIKNYILRPGDILHIRVISIDPRLSAFLNVDQNVSPNYQATPGSIYLQGYLVDDSGYVELPILGKYMANGLNLNQFKTILSKDVNDMVSTSTVIVKLMNIKITVSGQVRTPNMYYFYIERISIMEALSSAGDLLNVGDRSNIEVVRQHPDGSFERGTLNLNDPNVVHNPYFYLQPNDIVYVPPTRTLAAKFNVDNVTLVLSSITAIILILSFAKAIR